jgi:hypothetical protein
MDYRHLARMTDETGMIQFSVGGEPDPESGYTVDDNARALMVALNMEDGERERYAALYTRFLKEAQRPDGTWCNLRKDGVFLPDLDSEDCQGRALLALSSAAASDLEEVSALSREMLEKALPANRRLHYLRSQAYTLIGLLNCTDVFEERRNSLLETAEEFSQNLIRCYQRTKSPGWYWFEERVTYCNGILPQALFAYYSFTGDRGARAIARDSLMFLCDHLFARGYLNVVGNRGWWRRGEDAPLYDQQPVDACSMVLACREAYLATGEKQYLELAQLAREWYQGKNVNKMPLVNPETGGCHDALIPEGLNPNQGAEALLSLLYSEQVMQRLAPEGEAGRR